MNEELNSLATAAAELRRSVPLDDSRAYVGLKMLEAMSRRAMELDGIQQQLKVREIQKLVDELAG